LCICADKNSKEQYIKKLQLCMKTYDYKDEQKDVKGKVSFTSNHHNPRRNQETGCPSNLSLSLSLSKRTPSNPNFLFLD
jgi:hypothetical protein